MLEDGSEIWRGKWSPFIAVLPIVSMCAAQPHVGIKRIIYVLTLHMTMLPGLFSFQIGFYPK